MPIVQLLRRIVEQRAGARTLAVVRIIIGLCAVAAALELWRLLSRLLDPLVVQLSYFERWPRLPQSTLPIFIFVWLISALAFTVGWKTRLAGIVLVCLSGYTLLLDEQTYSNHFYLFFLIILLLTVAESGADLSVDARRGGKAQVVPGWPVLLLKIQASLVYGFSALAKLTPQYLSGEVLTQTMKHEGWLVFPIDWRVPWLMRVLALAAIVLELFVAIGLWSSRLRAVAVVAGIALHAFILMTLDSSRLSLGIFALEMFALYVLFFDKYSVSRDRQRPNSTTQDN